MNRIAILMAMVLTAIGVVGPGSAQASFTLTKSGISYVGVVDAFFQQNRRVVIVTAPFDNSACVTTLIASGDRLRANTTVLGHAAQDSILFIAAETTICGTRLKALTNFNGFAFDVKSGGGTDFLIGNNTASLQGQAGNDIIVAAAFGSAKGGLGRDKVFGGGWSSALFGDEENDALCASGTDRNARVLEMHGGSGEEDEVCGSANSMSGLDFISCANCTYTFF